jgi:hypothetical protein
LISSELTYRRSTKKNTYAADERTPTRRGSHRDARRSLPSRQASVRPRGFVPRSGHLQVIVAQDPSRWQHPSSAGSQSVDTARTRAPRRNPCGCPESLCGPGSLTPIATRLAPHGPSRLSAEGSGRPRAVRSAEPGRGPCPDDRARRGAGQGRVWRRSYATARGSSKFI